MYGSAIIFSITVFWQCFFHWGHFLSAAKLRLNMWAAPADFLRPSTTWPQLYIFVNRFWKTPRGKPVYLLYCIVLYCIVLYVHINFKAVFVLSNYPCKFFNSLKVLCWFSNHFTLEKLLTSFFHWILLVNLVVFTQMISFSCFYNH